MSHWMPMIALSCWSDRIAAVEWLCLIQPTFEHRQCYTTRSGLAVFNQLTISAESGEAANTDDWILLWKHVVRSPKPAASASDGGRVPPQSVDGRIGSRYAASAAGCCRETAAVTSAVQSQSKWTGLYGCDLQHSNDHKTVLWAAGQPQLMSASESAQ